MQRISLPANDWRPRDYQTPAWKASERGIKRHVLIWHRRAGKDEFALHRTACAMFEKVGTYWHMLPQANQARKAIWDAINPHTGQRRIDEAFPKALRETTREAEMFIRFHNGSTWQLVGSDNYNSLVGSPPIGVIYSEYALADPSAWAFLRPILAENGGWAMFITTPRGRNHAARLYQYGREHPEEWYAEMLTVDDTNAMSPAIIEREKRELIGERGLKEAQAIIDQEYYCSFDAAIPGTYYAEFIQAAEREGRVGDYPWMQDRPVVTAWDIGYGDSTAVFFAQWTNKRWRIIDYMEGSGVGPDWYAKKLAERPYRYDPAILPHDANSGHISSGKSFSQQLTQLGVRNRVLPRAEIDPGIQAGRKLIREAEFNVNPVALMGEDIETARARLQRGMDCLRSYRREWSEKNQAFKDRPLHDWASNGADAWRYLAVGLKPPREAPTGRKPMTAPVNRGWKVFG